jgi:glycine/D-amino acid oxidase-like deaminating enzyme
MARTQPNIVIIGAGLQGLCVALALAHRGLASTVLDQRAGPFRGASQGNEGKIHLGLVYALDPTGRTGALMLKGALCFSPLIDRWCGPMPWHRWKSPGFRYAIMPDSLAGPPMLHAYYEKLKTTLPDVIGALAIAPSYFGELPSWFWKPADSRPGAPLIDGVAVHCLDTQEIAIDTDLFARELLARIGRNEKIRLRCSTRVESVERCNGGYRLALAPPAVESALHADIVINCAWTDRPRLDRLAGIAGHSQLLSYRVKHRVIVRSQEPASHLLPVTMVQGPYGDLVPLKNGNLYLSWYPECRTHFDTIPPAQEVSDPVMLSGIADRTVNTMAELFPELRNARVVSCTPCTIVANGLRDVNEPRSGLHRRDDSGPRGQDGWWSVDTGKLTLAPLHADTTANLVLEAINH